MKKFKMIFQIIFRNWITLLYFEIIYKTFGFIIVFPFIKYLAGFLPWSAGQGYLSQENIGVLLKSPLAVLLGLLIVILAALYTAGEITAFMLLCEHGWHRRKVPLIQLCRQTAAKTLYLLRPCRIGVFLMLLVLMLSVFSPVSGYLKNFRIPEFIAEFLMADRTLSGILLGLLAVFHILLLLYLFGFPSMLLEGKSFLQSWRESLNLIRTKKLKTAGTVMGLIACFLLLALAAVAVFVLLLGGYTGISADTETGRQMFVLHLVRWLSILRIVISTLTSAFLCAMSLTLYHLYRGEEQEAAVEETGRKAAGKRILFYLCNVAVLISVLTFFSETEIGGAAVSSAPVSLMLIAHRAGAAFAPENTMAALDNAIRDGADAVETDIQQMGDGTLIIMHDTNFRRTAGLDLNVWDADYEKLQSLNANLGEEAIPTLEEFLKGAKGQMNLMLELKASGHEREIEQGVLRLIRKYDMGQQCMIVSMDLNILKRVKELEPAMETAYISAILITGPDELSAVDGYSVETTFLSPEMVMQAQGRGKKIFVWTVNSGYTLEKALRCDVDGIITDNVPYAGFYIGKYGNNLLVEAIVSLFYGEHGSLDGQLLLWIQETFLNPLLTPFFIFMTRLGDSGRIWIVISLILLLFKRTRKAGLLSLFALLGSLVVNNVILKNLVGRIRPYEALTGVQLLIEKQSDFSFPSGHTGSSFASALILYLELPGKSGFLFLVLACLIAFSRLYLGVHYPLDVLAAVLTGSFIAWGIHLIFKRRKFYELT